MVKPKKDITRWLEVANSSDYLTPAQKMVCGLINYIISTKYHIYFEVRKEDCSLITEKFKSDLLLALTKGSVIEPTVRDVYFDWWPSND